MIEEQERSLQIIGNQFTKSIARTRSSSVKFKWQNNIMLSFDTHSTKLKKKIISPFRSRITKKDESFWL